MGCDPGSGWFPSPTSGVRLLGGLRAWQAAHLVVRPVSYAGRAGFDPLACYPVPLAQRQVQSPDERTTEVRVLHGTRFMVCAV